MKYEVKIMEEKMIQELFKCNDNSAINPYPDGFEIIAPANSNFYISPDGNFKHLDMPLYLTNTLGDFTLQAKVRINFRNTYDAACLMLIGDATCWAKLAFEYTDLGTYAVVSVVTNGVSDDANGVNIDGMEVYLQLAKKDNTFAMYYSIDGRDYKMVRYFTLPIHKEWRVGFAGQTPLGTEISTRFQAIDFKTTAPNDLRKGI